MPLGSFLKILLSGLAALAALFIATMEFSAVQTRDNMGNYESYEYAAKEYFESSKTFVVAFIKWFGSLSAEELIALFTGVLAIATIMLWIVTQRILKDARRTTEKQLRAYVHMTNTFEITFAKDAAGNEVFIFQIIIKNYGLTPASVQQIILSTRVITDGNIDAINWPDRIGKEEPFFIPPGDERGVNYFEIPMADAKRLGPDYRLLYRFYFEYFTVFNDVTPEHSASAFEVIAVGDPEQIKKGIAPSRIFSFPSHFKGSSAT